MKRLLGCGSAVLILWILAGCQTQPARAPAPAPPSGSAAQAAVILRPPDHSIVHPASGMRFPESVAEFRRGDFTQSPNGGLLFTCDYRLSGPGAPVTATVTLYPAPSATAEHEGLIREARPGLADAEYQMEVKKILNDHPQTTVVAEHEYALAQGVSRHVGRFVEFEYPDHVAGKLQNLTTRLYLFNNVDETWAVKFRFTYPHGAPADKVVTDFLAELRWSLRDS